jgi:hypothetical protein
MKKLTNTYFKKSKTSEKAIIMSKELTSQKLHFIAHRKNAKSVSEGSQAAKVLKYSKPFTEDMIEDVEKQQKFAARESDKLSEDDIKRETTSEIRIA